MESNDATAFSQKWMSRARICRNLPVSEWVRKRTVSLSSYSLPRGEQNSWSQRTDRPVKASDTLLYTVKPWPGQFMHYHHHHHHPVPHTLTSFRRPLILSKSLKDKFLESVGLLWPRTGIPADGRQQAASSTSSSTQLTTSVWLEDRWQTSNTTIQL